MKAVVLALLMAVTPLAGITAAWAARAPETLADPALESRARHLQRELRCLVCQGESIDDSNAELAVDLRRLVRDQIAAGRTDQEIKGYLVARYGDFILMQPPVKPHTYLLWLAPFLVLAGAGGVAALVIARARKTPDTGDFVDPDAPA